MECMQQRTWTQSLQRTRIMPHLPNTHEPSSSSAAPLELESPAGGAQPLASLAMNRKLLSTLLINLAAVLEKAEENLLPAVYSYIGASFSATPTQLGYLTLCRALTQALSAPLGGITGHYLHRGRVVGTGCLLWAATTALFSLSGSLSAGAAIWAVNGVGLALVIPNTQSLTADFFAAGSRGRAFGALWLTASLGGMVGSLYATNMGSHRPLGMDGWRFVFITVAAASAAVGCLNLALTQDPRRQRAGQGDAGGGGPEKLSAKALGREMLSVTRIPTFLLIVIQGIAGSIPWSALVFLTLYFQLLGMSNAAASGLVALFLGGVAVGGLLGGWVGDMAAARWPNHGRIAVTQFSVFTGIPFSILLLKGLPKDGSPHSVAVYGGVLLVFALLKAWPAPACNNPVFAQIVPQEQRTLVYAMDRCFEGAVAACAAPLVGLLAAKAFGFKGAGTVTHRREVDLANAKALGNALLAFMLVPWCWTLVLYTGLHFTYPRDRRAALGGRRRGKRYPAAPPPATAEEEGGPAGGERLPLRLAGAAGSSGALEEFCFVDYEIPVELQSIFPELDALEEEEGTDQHGASCREAHREQ